MSLPGAVNYSIVGRRSVHEWLAGVRRCLPISLNVVSISSSPIANLGCISGNGIGHCACIEERLQGDNGYATTRSTRIVSQLEAARDLKLVGDKDDLSMWNLEMLILMPMQILVESWKLESGKKFQYYFNDYFN